MVDSKCEMLTIDPEQKASKLLTLIFYEINYRNPGHFS